MSEKNNSDGAEATKIEAAAEEENTADVPLNREQRRAQAKGKKGGSAVNPLLPNAQHMRGPGTGGAAPGATARFQRKTGGK